MVEYQSSLRVNRPKLRDEQKTEYSLLSFCVGILFRPIVHDDIKRYGKFQVKHDNVVIYVCQIADVFLFQQILLLITSLFC